MLLSQKYGWLVCNISNKDLIVRWFGPFRGTLAHTLDLSRFQLTCMPIKLLDLSVLLQWTFCNLQGATIDIHKLDASTYGDQVI